MNLPIHLNLDQMNNLSFPDFEVEKMELLPREKKLKIHVEGAWLEMNEGLQLGKGILFFNEWESLAIKRFHSDTKSWSTENEFCVEPLRDLCEVKFFDDAIVLCGFGKKTSEWMEWKIVNSKMHAEFENL